MNHLSIFFCFKNQAQCGQIEVVRKYYAEGGHNPKLEYVKHIIASRMQFCIENFLQKDFPGRFAAPHSNRFCMKLSKKYEVFLPT